MCRAVGFWLEKKAERYIEDTDRFPGWKGELPVPIQDFRNGSDAGAAPASLTIGVGADGKVHLYSIPPYIEAAGYAWPYSMPPIYYIHVRCTMLFFVAIRPPILHLSMRLGLVAPLAFRALTA